MSNICNDNRKVCCDLYLGTDHVLLDKVIFEVLGSLERDNLTSVLKEIDSKFKEYDTSILFRTRMINVGASVPVYKGYDFKNGHQFKTLKSKGPVSIKDLGNEIEIDVDLSNVPNRQDFEFLNVGSGIGILESSYKVGDKFHANFSTISSSDFVVSKDPSKTVLVNYTIPDKVSITELKTINFTEYVEIVRNAIVIANAKLK